MIQAILFDFGGTLDADGLHWLDRFYSIYSKNGLGHIPKELVKEAFYWADAQADLDPSMRKAKLRDMMERHARWQFQKLNLKDEALQFIRPCERILRRNRNVLEKLSHAGLKLGVISNFYGNVEVLCKEFSFDTFMNVILDSAVVGLKKPDPKIFELALSKLQVTAAQTAFVGDSFERDMMPAKALGMKTFWLMGDVHNLPPAASQVDVVLHSLEDLPHKFKEAIH
jgi:putative hydrolase of the HAD superfamily